MSHVRARLTQTQVRTQSVSQQKLAFLLLVLTIGLLGWRALTVFTAPNSATAPSAFERIAETVTGPHEVRVEQGENGALVILIDGPAGALASADANKLSDLASTLYPSAPPAIIRQYPFASGSPARPGNSALAELAVLGVLGMLAFWLVLTLTRNSPASVKPQAEPIAPEPQPRELIVTPKPASRAFSPVEKAAQLAQKDPETAAAVISKWLRQEEGHA